MPVAEQRKITVLEVAVPDKNSGSRYRRLPDFAVYYHMILYQNSFITLEYNPYTDVLHAELPSVITAGMQELEHALQIVAEQTKNYTIGRLLLDPIKVVVKELDDTSYRKVMELYIS